MEYEICDEERLFDNSTNPSLQPLPSPANPAKPIDLKRKEQSGVLIPDEEPENQLTWLADRVGFEPTVGLHLRRFSRPLP
jgi:hypothetical protein